MLDSAEIINYMLWYWLYPFIRDRLNLDTMAKDIKVVANDLKLYFQGFEVALASNNISDAIRYLKDMRRELNDNLDYLQSKQESETIQQVMKQNLQESLADYKDRVKRLEEELKKGWTRRLLVANEQN